MPPRWSPGAARRRLRAAHLFLVAVVAVAVAGCGHSAPEAAGHPAPASTRATACGTARSAAGVPVKVEITRGQVTCPRAMTVEHAYAKAIRDGQEPGNGGGGPVTISGWQCRGFPTPEVLRTGWASKCVRSGTEILAILPSPA